jgi:hypothetical protein
MLYPGLTEIAAFDEPIINAVMTNRENSGMATKLLILDLGIICMATRNALAV